MKSCIQILAFIGKNKLFLEILRIVDTCIYVIYEYMYHAIDIRVIGLSINYP